MAYLLAPRSRVAVAVLPQQVDDLLRAQHLATQLSLPLVTNPETFHETPLAFLLVVDSDRIALRPAQDASFGEVCVDFVSGASAYRRSQSGINQDIARAVGMVRGLRPRILDACAGLGRDAFVLATLGCEVVLIERHPVVFALLENGLQRAQQQAVLSHDSALLAVLARMKLQAADAQNVMPALVAEHRIDVIYLDPMFPERRKTAAVKKEMAAFHTLVGGDDNGAALLQCGLSSDVCRVVVKRPRLAASVDDTLPSHQITGKSTRYDVYVRRAIPPLV